MNRSWLWRLWSGLVGGCLALLGVIGFVSLSHRWSRAVFMTDTRPTSCARAPHYRRLWLGPVVIWLVLLIILAVSAWSAFLPLGPFNPTTNLLLAALMLFLLATFLMDLKNANAVVRLVAAAGLFWIIFLFVLTFTDYLSRRPTVFAQPAHGAALDKAEH